LVNSPFSLDFVQFLQSFVFELLVLSQELFVLGLDLGFECLVTLLGIDQVLLGLLGFLLLKADFSVELVSELGFSALDVLDGIAYVTVFLDLVLELPFKQLVFLLNFLVLSAPLLSFMGVFLYVPELLVFDCFQLLLQDLDLLLKMLFFG